MKTTQHKNFKKWRIVWLALAGSTALLGIGLVLFITVKPFREKIDDLYYEAYAARYVNPTLEQLTTKRGNIAYCGSSSSRFQKLDIYIPKHVRGPMPAVVYIHGGGWAVGDKASTKLTEYGTGIVRNKMVLISINYRLAPTYTFPAQNRDVACALSYLKSHGTEYKIDTNNIGLWGDSAGGQLAAMTALDPQYKRSVAAVVEFYGTADLWAQIKRTPKADRRAIAYIGSATDRRLAERASPLYVAPGNLAGAPAFLLVHGVNDKTVAYSQSVAMEKQLRAAGVEVYLRSVRNADHNFSIHSQPTAAEIETEMVQFFKRHLVR